MSSEADFLSHREVQRAPVRRGLMVGKYCALRAVPLSQHEDYNAALTYDFGELFSEAFNDDSHDAFTDACVGFALAGTLTSGCVVACLRITGAP